MTAKDTVELFSEKISILTSNKIPTTETTQ